LRVENGRPLRLIGHRRRGFQDRRGYDFDEMSLSDRRECEEEEEEERSSTERALYRLTGSSPGAGSTGNLRPVSNQGPRLVIKLLPCQNAKLCDEPMTD
jgi:hypothetical protein